MGEGASGGGGGGSEDRRSTSAPSARPVQRPTQQPTQRPSARPDPVASAPSARPVQRPSARPDPVAPAPRGGGRGGDPRQFGFDPAAAAAARAPRPSALTPGMDVALRPPRLPESRTFSPSTPRVPSAPRDIFVDEFPAGMDGSPVSEPPRAAFLSRDIFVDEFPAGMDAPSLFVSSPRVPSTPRDIFVDEFPAGADGSPVTVPPPMSDDRFTAAAAQRRRNELDRFAGGVADSVDYLLGPTGIPSRLRGVNQMANPVVAIEDAMVQSGRAANSDLPVGERARAAGSAGLTTALFGIPSLLAARGFIPAKTAVAETLSGISSAPKDFALGPLDIRNRIAADEFMAQYPGDELGTFEGAYVPDSWQISGLQALPDLSLASPGEQRYLKSLSAAEDMRALGATPQEIFARTGIVNVPRRDVTGAEIGPEFLLSTSTAPKFSAIDQNALDRVIAGEDLMLRDVMDLPENLQEGLLAAGVTRATVSGARLGRKEMGYFDEPKDKLVLNTRYPEEARPTTRHEAAHLYLSESGVPTSAVGSSPAREAQDARRALFDIENEVAAAENAYRMGDIDSDQLQEAYNAAAMQRTAYSRSPLELYSENLGEILARRAENKTSQYVTAGLREAFNPHIPTTSGVNQSSGLFGNVLGAVTAPLEQAAFQAFRAADYPTALAPGILAQVPSNIFTRATTSQRVPVFNTPFSTVTSGQDPWANLGNERFDFDAFD